MQKAKLGTTQKKVQEERDRLAREQQQRAAGLHPNGRCVARAPCPVAACLLPAVCACWAPLSMRPTYTYWSLPRHMYEP